MSQSTSGHRRNDETIQSCNWLRFSVGQLQQLQKRGVIAYSTITLGRMMAPPVTADVPVMATQRKPATNVSNRSRMTARPGGIECRAHDDDDYPLSPPTHTTLRRSAAVSYRQRSSGGHSSVTDPITCRYRAIQ